MKIVINTCFGGFSLSEKAYLELNKLGIPIVDYDESVQNQGKVIFKPTETGKFPINRYWDTWLGENRTNPLLIQAIENIGVKNAAGVFAELKIINIPDDIEYTIEEYDGMEHIAEKHRTWG